MNKKVLIVEDNAFLLDIYSDVLKELELDFDIAKTGDEAYEKAHIGGYDLILMDVMLPKMNGFDVVKKLKDTPPEKENKQVIFMTSLDSDDEMAKAKDLGDGFIKKSDLTPGDFKAKIQEYLRE